MSDIGHFKYLVVEDNKKDVREVLFKLSDAGFNSEKKLGQAETYDEAKNLLERFADQLDVLFLDLNLPRNATDSRPERGHGKALLDLIHENLNRRPNVFIQVIIVSGEVMVDGIHDQVLYDRYGDTLAGIVLKSRLVDDLPSMVSRLHRDPLRYRVSMLKPELINLYEKITDSTNPIKERLHDARILAIRLVQNEVDYRHREVGISGKYADDLNRLIKDEIEIRFNLENGRRYIKASKIVTRGGWGSFLWRGTMVQHIYALNSYYNHYKHIHEQPFRNPMEPDEWLIPLELLDKFEAGETIGKIVELIVRDLLEWYLPWHEQVYLPWSRSLTTPE
jgi:hypothetical protein